MLTRHGRHFGHVELWNEPNNLPDWDWRVDTDHQMFCEMAGGAAHWINERGWKAVLGGPCPFDPVWLDLMGQRGLLAEMAAVGLHGFPGTWGSEEGSWQGWGPLMDRTREILDRYNPGAEIWLTKTGYSTSSHDEAAQLDRFVDALDAGADRVYWYGWADLSGDVAVQEGLWFDPRHYQMGVVDAQNRPKLPARLLAWDGVERVREMAQLAAPDILRAARPVVITGGSGFIGSNLADDLLSDGREMVVLDNLSRPGVERNLE